MPPQVMVEIVVRLNCGGAWHEQVLAVGFVTPDADGCVHATDVARLAEGISMRPVRVVVVDDEGAA